MPALINAGQLTQVDLTLCDQEPIHIPGSIQPHGVLLVARRADLIVTHASLNLGDWLGYTPRAALGRSLQQLLGEDGFETLAAELANERISWGKVLTVEPPRASTPLHMVVHTVGDSICLELEAPPPGPDLSEGTQGAMAVMQALRSASSQLELCDVVAAKMRELTGYDRVMVYRFQRDGHGEVIAEARDRNLEPYLGQSYPASDIPRQARRMYLTQRVRLIADASYVPVPVLPDPALGPLPPLDMTRCALRSVSPVHVEYMRNMGTQGTLSVSLIPGTSLWGLLVCHHREPRIIPADLRAQIDMIGQLVSLLLGSLGEMETYAQQLSRQHALQEVVARMAPEEQVANGLAASGEALLSILAAGGAVVQIAGRTLSFGTAPPVAAATRAMRVLSAVSDQVVALDELQECVPDWRRHSAIASGALFLPLPSRPEDGIIWFRPEMEREVKWAGDPRKAAEPSPKAGRISPRRSFAAWRELVRGRSAPWLESDWAIAREFQHIMTVAIARQAEAEKARLSDYDPLTGLANRRLFQDRLALHAADPTAALLCLDLDRFKTVNDTFGHPTGDALLCAVASRLQGCVREGDLIVRLGGDEFAIVQTGAEQPLSAETTAQRIVERLSEPFSLGEHDVSVGASVGVAFAHTTVGDARTLLKQADMALYRAKEAGRGTYRVFRPEFHDDLQARIALEAELQQALASRQLELFYQPIIDAGTERLCALEALLRWRHPSAGVLPPADFIPIAEANGLIVPIGAWVLHEACRQASTWPDTIKVAVNLSAVQIQSALVATTREALAQSGLRPSRLELEITETVLLKNPEAIKVLHALRDLGVRIVLDDFGTGYSTLRNLLDFDFDCIKIDKSFVCDLGRDRNSTAIVRAVVTLARSLEVGVTAEGVETMDQLLQLRAEGCTHVQGLLFSAAVDPGKLPRLLAQHAAEGNERCDFVSHC